MLYNDINSVFNVNTIDEGVINKIFSNLNNKSSFGHDGISTNLLKKLKTALVLPLTIVINQSIRTEHFRTG